MKIAVVILNWNGAEMLRRYLPSVVKHSGADAEVWVADNASTDDSMDIVRREFPSVKTLCLDKNYGFAEGYNRALSKIKAEYFVLLNSDVEVTAEWLSPLADFLDSHPDVVAVQPKLLKAFDPKEKRYVSDGRHAVEHFEYAGAAGGFVDRYGYPYCRGRIFGSVEADFGQYNVPMEIHWATGACLMIRAEQYRSSGGLDHRFFAHNEEIDLCWRLRIMGWKIYCIPQSRVFHLGGGTLPQGNPRKTYLNFRNNLTMLYKNLPEERLVKILRARTLLDYIAWLQSVLTGKMGDAKAIVQARKDFRQWQKDFLEDRMQIQSQRVLPPDEDLTKISILWQYYALRRKRFSDFL